MRRGNKAKLVVLMMVWCVPAMNCYASSQRDHCIKNLDQIEGAKRQCAEERSLKQGDSVRKEWITPYLRGDEIPSCPLGGTYTINRLGRRPSCSIKGHSLATVLQEETKAQQRRTAMSVVGIVLSFVLGWLVVFVTCKVLRDRGISIKPDGIAGIVTALVLGYVLSYYVRVWVWWDQGVPRWLGPCYVPFM